MKGYRRTVESKGEEVTRAIKGTIVKENKMMGGEPDKQRELNKIIEIQITQTPTSNLCSLPFNSTNV